MTIAKMTSGFWARGFSRYVAPRFLGGSLAVALAVVFLRAAHPAEGSSATRATLLWAGTVLVSCTGWGSALTRVTQMEPRLRPDWGLRAAFGMAVIVTLGGCLLAVGHSSGPVLRVMVGVGVLLECAELVRARPICDAGPSAWGDPAFVLVSAVVYALAFTVCVGSMVDLSDWYRFDDGPAYLVFPKEILETGDLLQPFSIRRMVGFGGQPLLQAVVLLGSPLGRAHLFDHGLCTVIVLALILGLPRGPGCPPVALRFLYAMLVLFMPNPRMNVASVLSGAVFFFAIYRTLDLPLESFRSRRGRAVVLGLLAAACCALRPSYVLPAIGAVAFSQALAKSSSGERRVTLRESAQVAVVVALALLPWCVCLFRSNETFLFPPFHGGYRPETGFTRFVLGPERLYQLRTQLRNFEPIGAIHLFFLGGLIMTDESPRRAMKSSFLSYFALGFLALLLLLPIVDHLSLARYRAPAEVAFMLVVLARAFGPAPRATATRNLVGSAIVLLACCVELAWRREPSTVHFEGYLEATYDLLAGRELADPLASPIRDSLAARIQATVPPGKRMLVMLEDPYRLDFERNPIEILDVPGIVSPGEGLPFFRGQATFAEYLLAHDIRYVAYEEPLRTHSLYDRPQWQQNALDTTRMPHNFAARYVLDVFDNLDQLKRTREHVFDGSDAVVLDLATLTR